MLQEAIEVLTKVWPLVLVQVGLTIWALTDIFKRKTFRLLSKGAWIVVVIVVATIGPLLYFGAGRGEE